jgi:hypothetical protein
MVINTKVFSQDYIIKINRGIKTIQASELSIIDEKVSFKDNSSEYETSLSLDDVLNINFYSDKPDELNIFSFSYDTIRCTIDSISKNKVFYRDKNNLLQFIDKNEIFSLHFNELSSNPQIDKYKNLFIQLQKSAYNQNSHLIKNDGANLTIVKLLSLNEGKLEIIIVNNGVEIKTIAEKTKIKSFINKEPNERANFYPKDLYLLSNQGSYTKISVKSIHADEISFDIYIDDRNISSIQKKNTIDALFFYDFRQTEIKGTPTQLAGNTINYNKTAVMFSLNAGVGYLVAPADKGKTDKEKEAYNELRLGFTYDANFEVLFANNFGVGVKYNQFISKNTVNTTKNTIKLNFIGFTLLGCENFKNNKGLFYTSLSLGKIIEVNKVVIDGEDFKIDDSTFGAFLNFGVDFYLESNVSLNLKGGISGGINSSLAEIENHTRLDGMIGLKFIF